MSDMKTHKASPITVCEECLAHTLQREVFTLVSYRWARFGGDDLQDSEGIPLTPKRVKMIEKILDKNETLNSNLSFLIPFIKVCIYVFIYLCIYLFIYFAFSDLLKDAF